MKKIALLALFFTGCATIMSGKHQEVSFRTNPEGAQVSVGGKIIGTTPITTTLAKKSGQTLVFEKEGYKPLTMELSTNMNGWFWGNIVLGGFFGSTTDGISGAVNQYSPNQYMVSLEPTEAGKLEATTTQPKQQKAREFIVQGYQNIMDNLAKGQGAYLTSLYNLLEIKNGEEKEAFKKIKALSEAYPDIVEFSDHVIALYLK